MAAKILVIEDNPANIELMSYLLAAFGYETRTAMTGALGIESARLDRPDLVLCDIQLPDMDGYGVARRFRAEPVLKSIPIVAVTALAMVGDRDRVMAAGFEGYLSKPIDAETFVSHVEAFLDPSLFAQSTLPSQANTLSAGDGSGGSAGSRHGTILVVDDSVENLAVFRSTLEPFGYLLISATTVAEGLELARSREPDLIICDIHLSGDSGFDLLAAVRSDPELCRIPFIQITSTALSESDRNLGLQLVADRSLVRPIEPEKLLAEVEASLCSTRSD